MQHEGKVTGGEEALGFGRVTDSPITEQKEAEEALKASETRFRTLWNIAVDAMALSDPDGKVIEANDAYFRLSGYSSEAILGNDFSIIFPEEERAYARKRYEQIFSAPNLGEVHESEIQRADGTRRFIESRVDFIVDKDGRRTALLSVIQDVTERKRAEEKERQLFNAEREQRLRAETLVEVTLALTVQTGFSAVLDEILKQTKRLVSFKTANIALIKDGTLQTAHSVGYGPQANTPFVKDVRPMNQMPLIVEMVKTGRPLVIRDVEQEPEWVMLPGSEWIRSFLAVPISLHNKVIGVLRLDSTEPNEFSERDAERLAPLANAAAIALSKAQMLEMAQQEIYERVQAEEALKESLRLIEQAKQDWEATADSFDQVIALLDGDGRLIRTNRPIQNWGLGDFTQQAGKTLHEVLHGDCPELGCYFPKYWTAKWPEILAGGQHDFEIQDSVLNRYLRIQLRPIVPNTRGQHQRADRVQVKSAVAVIHDITEQKRVEEAILHTQKLESLGILAGGIAHDFNNLLAGILSENSLALLRLPVDIPGRTNIERANQAIEKAADLTHQLLAYTGKGQFKKIQLNLNKVVRENLLLLEAMIPRSVQLVTNLAEELPWIHADTGQIQQVVMNLILNAAEAYEERSGKVVITTSIAFIEAPGKSVQTNKLKPGQYVCLTVADKGMGMDEATLERIFDPFFTTKFTGRGLGLSAVSGIVRQHEGDIQVESKVNVGTTFRVYMPVSTAEPLVETAAPLPMPDKKASILVIDDEVLIRVAVADFLSFFGQTVFTAENGIKGLKLFKEHVDEIDLVILDLTMPVMSGKETLIELHKIRPTLPVILLSGFSEEEALKQIQQSDRVDFLQKPFHLPHMLEKLNAMLA